LARKLTAPPRRWAAFHRRTLLRSTPTIRATSTGGRPWPRSSTARFRRRS